MKEGRFPNLSNLNKGKDIVFDIFMRNDYPFSSPRVYCATEVYAD
jgi:ubiquitin-protein ligase